MRYIKQLLSTINNFIQWTKKWHFFHLFIIPPFLLWLFCIMLYSLFFIILFLNRVDFSVKEFLMNDIVGSAICIQIFLYFAFFIIALISQIIFFIVNWIKYKKSGVRNQFMLKNKKYNGIYILAFINALIFLLT